MTRSIDDYTFKAAWDRTRDDDLPKNVTVYRITEGQRKYRWYCRKCGMTQQAVTKQSAFELAWDHVTGEDPCQ